MMKCFILGILVICATGNAADLSAPAKQEMLRCLNKFNKLGKTEKRCPASENQFQSGGDWVTLPTSEAQCTTGAKSAGHYAKIKISTYSKNSQLSIEALSPPRSDAVQEAIRSRPSAKYVGNGPIYMEGTHQPNGYVKASGRVIHPIDCVNFRTNSGNLGKENSVFVRYRPRTPSGEIATTGDWKYKVVSTSFLCDQLQPKPYVDWLQSGRPSGSDIEAELKIRKQWEPQEDLVSASQIDFAIQSGPGVLRQGQNLLDGYNSATSYRSYIGVNNTGDPVVVEVAGQPLFSWTVFI